MFFRLHIKLLLLIVFLPLSCVGASFDCVKAVTYSERYICSDKNASKLDDDISTLYKNLLPIEGNVVKDEQVKWLSERNSCKSSECVLSALNDRKRKLLTGADDFYLFNKTIGKISHNVVLGIIKNRVEFVRFLSNNDQNSDCNFVLRRVGDNLLSEDGYKIPIENPLDKPEFEIKLDVGNYGMVTSMCGVFAKLPKTIKRYHTRLTVDY